MRIRKWAKLSFFVAFGIMAVLSLLIWQLQIRTAGIRSTEETLDDLISDFTELHNLATEYRLNRGLRPKQQWFAMHKDAMKVLNALPSPDMASRLLPVIRHDSDFLLGLFEELVKYHEQNGLSNDQIMTRDVTTAQFELRIRSLITNIETWRTEALHRGEADEAVLVRLYIVSAICWLLFIGFNTYFLGRRVLNPIAILRRGAKIIGQGHLEHRVGLNKPDEIGDLADAIDSMSEQLQLITTSRDALEKEITERKKAEKELDGYRRHLEELVAERTYELEQARDTAEAANRAKTIFLANMSHELRTPLNAILGFAQIMARNARIPEEEQHNIATINRSGQHLLCLINDVLEISRIEAGRTRVTVEAFDFGALLISVEEMIRIRAESKRLGFTIERSAALPGYVTGDAHHLRQVLINLLGNAVKYTDEGGIALYVNAESDQRIGFEVTDTGPGISAQDQERIFKAFYQTTSGIAKGEGTGLGLTISREFVRLMGGELTVKSELGKGSTFAFDLPLPPALTIPYKTGRQGRIVGLAPDQSKPLILLAEDKADNQQVVVQLLEQIGCKVCVAANGREAIELFQSRRPDLILMDMRMPIMDGYEATRLIRSLPGGAELPIVAVTASVFSEEKEQVLAAGCVEMLNKPIEAERLFETLARLLQLRFEYAEAEEKYAAPAADLSAIPDELRKELIESAMVLDSDSVMDIVERLHTDHAAEAELLKKLAEEFRFDRIQTMLQQEETRQA